jgi:hypothetical protein
MAARIKKGDVDGAMNQFKLFTENMGDADVSKSMEILSRLLY